jgi:putative sigma-54 modulation protein
MSTSEAMNTYVTKKLEKLNKKFDWIINVNVHFERIQDPKGKGRICKMELSVPGPRIFATSNAKNYELAVKETIKELQGQLNKRKDTFKTY